MVGVGEGEFEVVGPEALVIAASAWAFHSLLHQEEKVQAGRLWGSCLACAGRGAD